MKFNAKRIMAVLLTALLVFSFGGCKSLPSHTADAPYYKGENTEESVVSEKTSSTVESDWWDEIQISSSASSQTSSSTSGGSGGKGNQIIVDKGPDVAKPNDPDDPMGPGHDAGEDKPLDDTVVLPPADTSKPSDGSSVGSSSKPNSSSSQISSKPDVSSTVTSEEDKPSEPDSSSTVTSTPSKPSSSAPVSSSQLSSSQASSSKPPFDPPKTGWYEYEGKKYLYQNGKPMTGYQRVSGLTYYFDADGVLSSKVGIDVSQWQGDIDWNKVKAAGVEYAIIRVGFRGYGSSGTMKRDEKFKQNLVNATSVGIDCGLYFFTQAKTKAEGEEEAEKVVEWIDELKKEKEGKEYVWPEEDRQYLSYPIYFDTELSTSPSGTGRADKLTKSERTQTVIGFCERMKKLGYYPGIYASTDWLKNRIDMTKLQAYDVWVAHYGVSKPGYTGKHQMWQYTSKGSIGGIKGNVDCNVGLFDYAEFIRKNGWNKLTD